MCVGDREGNGLVVEGKPHRRGDTLAGSFKMKQILGREGKEGKYRIT
jgi:hypothetical protein